MTTTLYGIKNCDTVKKARKWLESNSLEYSFHDFREQGLNQSQVEQWLEELGFDKLINKRSTTWKQLNEDEKAALTSGNGIDIILNSPTLIKRPVLEGSNTLHVGFKESEYTSIFGL